MTTTQTTNSTLATTTREALIACGVDEALLSGSRQVYSPIDGQHLVNIKERRQPGRCCQSHR